jgi:hypothetical protein
MSIDGIRGRSFSDISERFAEDEHDAVATSGSVSASAVDAPPASSDRAAAKDFSTTSALLLDGDIGAQVAALAILSARNQREANGLVRVAEEAALERAEAAQIAAMHEQAAQIRMGGLVEGGFTALNGGAKLGESFAITASARNRWEAASTAADAGAKGFGSLPRAAQKDAETRAAHHANVAGRHDRAIDGARDGIREGQDFLERALDFYRDHERGAADAESASVRRG